MVGMTQPGLDAAGEELYAGAPAVFVARRDELAKQARSAGDRPLAEAIKALRRPTVGAWYLNLAARAGLTSLRELLDLGEELRQTQSRGDFAALRDLAVRRNPLLARVLRDLTAHLATVGVQTTSTGLDEARTTLGAALADPAVDARVRAGRLDRPHTYGGFGEVEMVVDPSAGAPTGKGSSKDTGPTKEQLASARRELAAAERELAALAVTRREAVARVRSARKRAENAESELERARDALAVAEEEVTGISARADALTAGIEQSRKLLPEKI